MNKNTTLPRRDYFSFIIVVSLYLSISLFDSFFMITGEKEECKNQEDCKSGYCCAQHHLIKICKPLLQLGQVRIAFSIYYVEVYFL